MTKDYRHELQGLLRKLFQFDSADLDFGIYRIMNYKRDEIEKFIEEDLIKAVDVEFEKYSAKSKEEIEREIEEINKRIATTLGENVLLPSGDIKEMYRSSPIAKEFYKKKEDLKNNEIAEQHKAEIFSHIYQFFSRYYEDGDFISLRRYSRQNKYAIPYNGEEVLLHWANKDQYYIKTGEYFKHYSFKIGDYKVNFQLSDAEIDKNNNRIGNRFFLLKDSLENIAYDESAMELVIFFEYRAIAADETAKYGTRDVQKKILEEVHETIITKIHNNALRGALQKQEDERTILEKHLLRYTKRNTTDYFIHKDLQGFLSCELDFYIKNEILILDDLGSENEIDVERYISRIKVIKSISLKIIDFLAQIEDFQKKIFEKKKFVLRTSCCITIDYIPEAFYREILANELQIDEWRRLYAIGGKQTEQATLVGDLIDETFLENHPYLVLDTAFFGNDFKDRLLENLRHSDGTSIEDLDDEIGGLIVKSENWQALNLLQERYREQMKCIYIDPPYNTGNDEFVYRDNYQHSCWLSMIVDRMDLAKHLMQNQGMVFTNIDSGEQARLHLLLNLIFGEDNFITEIIWQKRVSPANDAKWFSSDHDTILVFSKNKTECHPCRLTRNEVQTNYYQNPDNDPRGTWNSVAYTCNKSKSQRPNLYYPIINPNTNEEIYPKETAVWAYSREVHKRHLEENKLYWGKDGMSRAPRYKKFLFEAKDIVPRSIWSYTEVGSTQQATSEFLSLFPFGGFPSPKPSKLIERIAIISTEPTKSETYLDFFAGSGTTANAILNLNREDKGNRKYILVEMADYFESVMKPRIQKTIYSANWKNGAPQDTNGVRHIFKCIELEQYEDSLDNIEFVESNQTIQKTLKELDGYFLHYMLPFETKNGPCRLNVDKLERPFDYTLKITKDNEIQDQNVDLVETFNYLLGLHVIRIRAFHQSENYYKIIYGKKGEELVTIIWRATHGLDLEADKKFIEDQILKEFKATKVYVNSDCFVEGVIPIEPEFKRLMEA